MVCAEATAEAAMSKAARMACFFGAHFAFLKNPFVLNMILLSICLVDPLLLSQFDVHT